ncbi:MAG: tetratricopeptide repeat protein [Armatimonadota bacterium]|nr:tetratricopeptide repeat protein [bacterium]
MNKIVITVLVIGAIIVVGCLGLGAWFIGTYMFGRNGVTLDRPAQRPIHVELPKEKSNDTLAVFNFRGSGDSSSRYWAAGFARSLADRLYCAPTSVTQELTGSELAMRVCQSGGDPDKPVLDAQSIKYGKAMGTRYVVTGDLTIRGKTDGITLFIYDTHHLKSKTVFKLSGTIADLPQQQVKATGYILKAMGIEPSPRQFKELHKSNFTSPDILRLYGESWYETDMKKVEAMRWSMVERDPDSSFAALRLLEYYWYGPSYGPELKSNAKLQVLLKAIPDRFDDNSLMHVWHGLLLTKMFEYGLAEKELREVAASDPNMYRAHSALAYVARCRQNGKLAIEQSRCAVDLWPDNAFLHACLAQSYNSAASNARQGHYLNKMVSSAKREWEENCNNSLREALIAVKMDRDCQLGWQNLMWMSLQLGRYQDRDKSYAHLRRIDPKDAGIYIDYGTGLLSQWDGSRERMDALFAEAEKSLGPGSDDACYVRACLLLSDVNHEKYRPEILQQAEAGLKASKGQHMGCKFKKCQVLFGLKRYDESIKVAEEAYRQVGSSEWVLFLGRDHALLYQNKHDFNHLRKARDLFAKYVREIPYDPYGHDQLGWCLSHLGQRAEAKKQFLRALELDPADEFAKEKMQYVQ